VRLEKNRRHLRKWLRNHSVSCYRLYDRDVPGFPYSIDVLEEHVVISEFETAPRSDLELRDARLADALKILQRSFGLPRSHLHLKTRRRKEGLLQYQKLGRKSVTTLVREGGHRFLVNLSDYLDVGIFLDHRDTRALIHKLSPGRRFLNLFCYTATASVYAVKGGATTTTSVDLSKTYLDWAVKNFELNGITGKTHRLVHADCMEWLRKDEGSYDLVFVDPPTFSNSKRMQDLFDLKKTHVELLDLVSRRLGPEGTILFSTNSQRFKVDAAALPHLELRDITRATIPKDFERNPKVHQCWRITRSED